MGKITKINLAGSTFEVQDERITDELLNTLQSISKNTQKLVFMADISAADKLSVLQPNCIYNVNGSALLIFSNSGASVGAMHQTLVQNGKILYRYNIKDATTTMDASYWSKWQDSGTKKIVWSAESNMNDFTDSGVYVCENGLRTNEADNLPILNTGNTHNFAFILQVAASNYIDNIAIGQTLTLTNRYGGETKQYIRTFIVQGWTPWREITGDLTLGNAGMVDERTLNTTTEWGEYNGVLFDPNWMNQSNRVLAQLVNAVTALSGAATYYSNEVRKSLDELYYGGEIADWAFKSNLFGAIFKMRVFENSMVLNGLDSIFPQVSETVRQYAHRRVVQELQVIPFTILNMEMSMYWGYQPRTITRFGDYNGDGTVTWSKFYEADGSESILQIEMTKFTNR